jgi:hypothetical protein
MRAPVALHLLAAQGAGAWLPVLPQSMRRDESIVS